MNIPLFPLNGVIFFPGSSLPLNIFEKKYIEMINYSLSTDRLIGMIQTKENGELYEVGCIGKIQLFEESNDGRYVVNLRGENFFSNLVEISTVHNFKIGNIKIINEKDSKKQLTIKPQNKKLLLDGYKKFIDKNSIQVDINLIKRVEDEDLVKFISMSSPFSNAEKQMLLETFDLQILVEKLIGLFDFYLRGEENKNTVN